MSEDDFIAKNTLTDCIITKLPIEMKEKPSKSAEKLFKNYPEAKLLVFTDDFWQLAGA